MHCSSSSTYNWYDYYGRRFIESFRSGKKSSRHDYIAKCFKDVVVMLSDTQLVTGIAILIAAMNLLGEGTITVYHFNMVTDLAWFSSNTHILALVVVRSFRDTVKPYRRQVNFERSSFTTQLPSIVRVILMLVLAVLLFYASWVSGYGGWYNDLRCPAVCTLEWPRNGIPERWMIVNFFYILRFYPIAMFLLFRKLRIWWMDNMRARIVDGQSLGATRLDHVPRFTSLHQLFTKGPRFIFLSAWYFLSSEFVIVTEMTVWYGLGVWWLVTDRVNGHDLMADSERVIEDTWGFGQLVPMLLLLLPIIRFFDSLAGMLCVYFRNWKLTRTAHRPCSTSDGLNDSSETLSDSHQLSHGFRFTLRLKNTQDS